MTADPLLRLAELQGWAWHCMATDQASQLYQQGNSSCKQQLNPPKRGWIWPMATCCPWQSSWLMPLMPLQHLQEVLQAAPESTAWGLPAQK